MVFSVTTAQKFVQQTMLSQCILKEIIHSSDFLNKAFSINFINCHAPVLVNLRKSESQFKTQPGFGPVSQSSRSSKTEPFSSSQNPPSDWLYICILVLHAEIENQISQLMIRTDRGWQCGQPGCDYVANKWSLRNHIESKHIDIGGIQCDHCSKVCPTRHALTMHIKRNHSF